jgi:hypothetical protein
LFSVTPYITKEVTFKFRGRIYEFALSHGLFSSADIDRGSRFLLRVLSKMIDDGIFPEGLGCLGSLSPKSPIRATETLSVLDAGCGCGVLGICAGVALADLARGKSGGEAADADAGAIAGAQPAVMVRAQDRDELARLFTEYNSRRNGLAAPARESSPSATLAAASSATLTAHAEALLAGPAGVAWDLILSNIPAKAGQPVLEDFIARSARMLKSRGLVLVVVVNPLASWFGSSITALGFTLLHEEAGKGHTVFAYRNLPRANGFLNGDSGLPGSEPGAPGSNPEAPLISGTEVTGAVFPANTAYGRGGRDFEIEGLCYHIDAVHGAAGFDRPGAAVLAAAKLVGRLGEKVTVRLSSNPAILIHEPDHGHFPAWFARYLPADTEYRAVLRFVLSGRNVLALEAARRNLERAADGKALAIKTVPAADIAISRDELALAGGFGIAVLFPDPVPQTDRIAAYWEGLAALLAENGIAIIALNASAAEKFDREKGPDFTRFGGRIGDFRREGFRALAYSLTR